MRTLAKVLLMLIAVEHFGIMILEMFFWTRPAGMDAFHLAPDFAQASRVLAANQGIYNGFLSAGLFFAVWQRRRDTQMFFLGCVIVAGIFGAMTYLPKILLVQALPATIALIVLVMSPQTFKAPSN